MLRAKLGQKVEVNIIYDAYGSRGTPAEVFDRLRRAGANLVAFHPVNPLKALSGYATNDRDHRKLLVADGAVAIVGGVNLSTDYQSRAPHPFRRGIDTRLRWVDTDIRIAGPVVAQLQHLFFAHWHERDGSPRIDSGFFPRIPAQGDEVVRIIGSSPSGGPPRFYVALLSAIRTAAERIWITTAYFVPTHQEMEDLMAAARRGVDVRLLLPAQSDSTLAIEVQHSRYSDLLESGVRIYETRGEILHSKTAVVDGVWSVVGSSNFDYRSVIFNDEVDAVLIGTATARQLEALFRRDLRRAVRIDLATWRRRPLSQWLVDHLARVWQSLL